MKEFSILIQGPTNFCRQVLGESFSEYPVIWSTWTDEPKDNLDFIADKKVKVVLNEKPAFPGFHNVNMQTVSTMGGLREVHTNKVFKTRGDMRFTNIDVLVEKIEKAADGRLAFLAYHTNTNPHYIVDFYSYGPLQESIKYWNYQQTNTVHTCPETQLLENYMRQRGESNHLSQIKRFYYFLPLLERDKQDIYWLKYPTIIEGRLASISDWRNVHYIAV